MKIYITTDYAKLDGVIDLVTDRKDGEFAFNTLKNSKEWNKSELYLFEITFNEKLYDYEWDNRKIEFIVKDNEKEIDKTKLENRVEIKTILSTK